MQIHQCPQRCDGEGIDQQQPGRRLPGGFDVGEKFLDQLNCLSTLVFVLEAVLVCILRKKFQVGQGL